MLIRYRGYWRGPELMVRYRSYWIGAAAVGEIRGLIEGGIDCWLDTGAFRWGLRLLVRYRGYCRGPVAVKIHGPLKGGTGYCLDTGAIGRLQWLTPIAPVYNQ
jgi:hypothetical protein